MNQDHWQEVTLIGLGNQGLAWAQNLKESSLIVHCYLRENSPKQEQAKDLNLNLISSVEEAKGPLLLLIPDHQIFSFIKENSIPKGSPLIYAHGASLIENDLQELFPEYSHCLLAPKAIASELREEYKKGGKLGAVYSVEYPSPNEESEELRTKILKLAQDLGITAGPYEVTFKQETTADLLSEQSLLCGLIPYAAKACYDRLRQAGIPQELAYLEAWHEVKLIGNAMSQKGPAGLFDLISPHALAGAHKASQMLFDKGYQETIEKLLTDIENGQFFKEAHSFFNENENQSVEDFWGRSEINQTYLGIKDSLT